MAKLNGLAVRLDTETAPGPPAVYKKFASELSVSLDLSSTQIDVTSKENDGWGDFLNGTRTGEVAAEAFYNTTPGANEVGFDEALTYFNETQPRKFRMFFEQGSPDKVIAFMGILNKLAISAPNNEGVKISFNIKVTGTPTIASPA